MNKADLIETVRAGLKAYATLNEPSKARTSKAQWIAFKLGCTEARAAKLVIEAEKQP